MTTIKFDTNDDHKTVILRDIENFGSAGCRARLIVKSNGFMCDRPFEFDNAEVFLKNITLIKNSLKGEAKLYQDHSDNYILLRATSLGHIELTGEIIKFDHVDQLLEFGFITDQTFLNALIKDFKDLINEQQD